VSARARSPCHRPPSPLSFLQAAGDLRTLRQLGDDLLTLDPVTFLRRLETLRAADAAGGGWLLADAAHTLFAAAKRRVYVLTRARAVVAGKRARDGGGGATEPAAAPAAGAATVVPVLEPLPKWQLVLDVLAEIQAEREALICAPTPTRADAGAARVVVVAREPRTVAQLAACAAAGGAGPVIQCLYDEYLAARLAGGGRVARSGGRGGRGRGRGRARAPTPAERLGAARAAALRGTPAEEAALLREARGLGGAGRGRGRGRGPAPPPSPPRAPSPPPHPLLQGVVFACTANGEAADALRTHAPSFVVLCAPDLATVRAVECHAARRPDAPLRVYHLRYEDSLEGDAAAAAVARERRALRDLIQTKSHMALPDPAAEAAAIAAGLGDSDGGAMLVQGPASVLANESTRAGGGGAARAAAARAAAAASTVVVDVREFMSTLPSVLHRAGMTLAPATLEVGDYILTPALAVERKSLPDLRQSLQSGRLLAQATAMAKHYTTAALLIEFDGEKPFSLAPPPDPGAAPDSAARSTPARLALLVLHCPRLRLLWARSPHAAAGIFKALKAGAAAGEPDAEAATAVGAPRGDGDATTRGGENEAAIDMLRRLPGVTDANWRALAAAGGTMAGVAALSEADLVAAVGGAVAARRLRAFLDAPCPAVV